MGTICDVYLIGKSLALLIFIEHVDMLVNSPTGCRQVSTGGSQSCEMLFQRLSLISLIGSSVDLR
jgi:hypothetical protein